MGTTPNRGFPYPEGTDYVASGDDAFQALAEAVDDALTTRMWATGRGGAEAVVMDSDWALDYATMDTGPGFIANPDGGVAPGFTYTGPSGRWFLISIGARVTSAGSSGVGLFLTVNNAIVEAATSGEDDPYLTISIPLQLTSGIYLAGVVKTYGAHGQYGGSWLRAVSL